MPPQECEGASDMPDEMVQRAPSSLQSDRQIIGVVTKPCAALRFYRLAHLSSGRAISDLSAGEQEVIRPRREVRVEC